MVFFYNKFSIKPLNDTVLHEIKHGVKRSECT